MFVETCSEMWDVTVYADLCRRPSRELVFQALEIGMGSPSWDRSGFQLFVIRRAWIVGNTLAWTRRIKEGSSGDQAPASIVQSRHSPLDFAARLASSAS